MSTPIKCLKYKAKYFCDDEFRRATPACSITDMNEQFMKCLDSAREYAGIPFIISSAYRSVEHELSKGRPGTSSHCKGIAVDIKCRDSISRMKIVSGLVQAGFMRIGIHSRFIHADMDFARFDRVPLLEDSQFKPMCLWLYDGDVPNTVEDF